MNITIKILPIFLMLSFLSSCGSLIRDYHKSFDQEEREHREQLPFQGDRFSIYRKDEKFWKRPSNSSKDAYIANSTANKQTHSPVIKRNYKEKSQKRHTAEDLTDNSSDGSLWNSKGQRDYLFTQNNYKRLGDIILLEVQGKLKKEISLELGRAFPAPKKKKKDDKEKKEEPKEETSEEDAKKVFDHISGVVIEELNKDHVLIRGRKDVLYQRRKRRIEVEALVSRKDISDDDKIKSSKLLESNISIIRY
ncbi:MAG: hypothetical protein COU30_01655 [Candidatus Magasanikbacteria bacterium CG10_big_fil_rev_8_21_14_0_10_38_6]|uniref:Flagellar biosynthesis protein FlgH n=1 Tax=Candidatus Magasanikbacteria bacterium CG10_big_fil_rev_8_21_14_0_10_38_6 TaxID=1974647 RepID=A0A2M6P1I7_9BACT|nr:MAG: hypothetical protein COU30_01655 [Candidatus Magasanikbacteria bacterium CG10_big_fil_rev_8_21_14_0_10_38_6]